MRRSSSLGTGQENSGELRMGDDGWLCLEPSSDVQVFQRDGSPPSEGRSQQCGATSLARNIRCNYFNRSLYTLSLSDV